MDHDQILDSSTKKSLDCPTNPLHSTVMDVYSIYRAGNLLHTEEHFTRYRPGGFHPVCLGDTFKDGRYKICHKLGFGGSSTDWLARDIQYVISKELHLLDDYFR